MLHGFGWVYLVVFRRVTACCVGLVDVDCCGFWYYVLEVLFTVMLAVRCLCFINCFMI